MSTFCELLVELQNAHFKETESYRTKCEELQRALLNAKNEKAKPDHEFQKFDNKEEETDVEKLAPVQIIIPDKNAAIDDTTEHSFYSRNRSRSSENSFIERAPRRLTPVSEDSRISPSKERRISTLSTGNTNVADRWPFQRRVAMMLEWEGFDVGVGFVIVANSIYIGFETQYRAASGTQFAWSIAVDSVFTTIYFLELFLRYYAMGFYKAMRCHWVQFDSFLVITAVLELIAALTPNFSVGLLTKFMVLRLLRLLKLARMLRLMTQFKTLWLLVNGLINSFLTIIWTLVLLGILVYIFSILALEVIEPDHTKSSVYNQVVEDSFGSFLKTVLTLFQFVTLDSLGAIYRPMVLEEPLLGFYFLAFVVLVPIVLINLVTAMMVECALDQAHQDKEVRISWEAAERKRKLSELRDLFRDLDYDSSGQITLEELERADDGVLLRLQEISKTEDFTALFKCIDNNRSGALDIDEFCDGVDMLCGGKLELHLIMRQMHKLNNSHHNLMQRLTTSRPADQNALEEVLVEC
jgi:voltage-gated sodium channel